MSDGALYRIKMAIIGLIILLAIDIYAYQAVRIATSKFQKLPKLLARGFYWSITVLVVFLLVWINTVGISDEKLRQWIIIWLGIFYFSKLRH